MHNIEHSSFSVVVVGAGNRLNLVHIAGPLLGNPMIQGSLAGQFILDGDIVEEKNCSRQAYQASEVNKSSRNNLPEVQRHIWD